MSDYALGSTIYWAFTTRAFATGVPTVLAGSPTLEIYENDSTSPIVEGASKLVLTVSLNSIVGFNLATITATSGNGFEAGKNYHIIIKTGTVGGTSVVGEVVGRFTLDAGAAFARLGAPAGASVSADIAAIEAQTDDIGAAGAGLTAVPWNPAWDAEVQSEVDDGLVAYNAASTTNITGGTITTVTNLTNERGKYAMGAVWIGPTANTNTASYVDGVITNPVSTIAAAKTVADALNLRRFYTVRTGATQIGAAMTGYDFDGSSWNCTTTGGSRDVGTSSFHNAVVTAGTFAGTTGAIWWDKCEFATGVSVGISNMYNCTFAGTTTLLEAGQYDFVDCASIVAGTAAPIFAVPAGVVNISFRRWSGGIKLTGLTADTTVSIDVVSGGTVTLEGTAATVVVRGMVTGVTNSMAPSAGTVTTTATCNQTVLATPTNITAGTITTVSGNVNGSVGSVTGAVGSVTGNVGGNVTGSVGSVVGAVGSVTGAVGSVTGNVGGNVVGSVGSVTGAVGSVTAEVTANVTKISGSAAAADNLEESTEAIAYGTVDGTGATTTVFLTSAMTPDGAVADQFKGRVLIFKSDTTTANLRGQATTISSHTVTSAEVITLTVVALTTAPSTGDTFVIL